MPDTSDNAQSATKHRARGKTRAERPGHRVPASGAAAPVLDDETAAALTLYNTYLIADREQQAHERALKKAERVKDEAAAAVRKLNDSKAPAAETAEAETRYREAVEALRRLRDGETADDSDSETAEASDGDAADQKSTDDADGEPDS